MTHDELIAYGFRQYTVAPHEKHDASYQFTVRDGGAKKLFVNVRFWRYSRYGAHVPDGWDAWVQFNKPTGNTFQTFNVELFHCADKTPQQVVDWFVDLHAKLGCANYEDAE